MQKKTFENIYNTPIYIYTNFASPYCHHLWAKIAEKFVNTKIILTTPIDSDRCWNDTPEGKGYDYAYFKEDIRVPKIGIISSGLFKWLLSCNAKKSIHFISSCSRGNRYMIRYIAKLMGGTLVHYNDGGFVEDLSRKILTNYKKRFTNSIDAVYTPGKIGHQFFKTLGYTDKKIFNSYFSHDVERFSAERNFSCEYSQEIKKNLGIKPDRFVLLTVSRLIGCKRLNDLVIMVKYLLKNTQMKFDIILIGDGELTCYCDELESLLGDNFHWLQAVPYNDMPKYYAASDLMVFPSEGDIWGLVVNEMLSMGKPVVCTSKIGASEMINDGINGFLLPIREPQLMARKVEELYFNRVLYNKMCMEAVKICESWNSDLAVKSLEDLVSYVLKIK